MPGRIRPRLLGLLVPAAVLLALAPANAQPGGGGRGGFDPLQASVSTSDLRDMKDILNMGDEQYQLVQMLYDGYQEQYRTSAEQVRNKFREAREKARDTGDWTSFQDLRDDMDAFRTTRDAMDKTFFDDVRSLLTPEQVEAWPKVERAHHRSQYLARGFVRGERVDLIEVVNEMSLEDPQAEAALAPILDSYEIALDRELMNRVKTYEEGWEKFGDMRRSGDMEGLQKLMEEGREASLRVRDVNDRFARQIAGALSADASKSFLDKVQQETFPDVFRDRQGGLAIAAARGFDDLDANQTSQIAAIESGYARDMASVNKRLIEAIQKDEEEVTMQDMFRRGRDREGPAADLWREKRELDTKALDRLKEVLNDAQVQRLPEPPDDRDDNGWRFGGRGGRGGNDRQSGTL